MRKSQQITKRDDERFNEWLARSSFVAGFAGIVSSLLGLLVSLYVYVSPSGAPKNQVPPFATNLLYLVGGIILLGIIIVAIGSFLRRKNRDVFLLKRRLSEIYLLALRKSALNPHPK